MDISEESNWLSLLRQGDHGALKSIFNRYFRYLHVTACNVLHDEEKAHDMVQDVFYELWRRREELEIHGQLKSYLARSVVNKCLNVIKARRLDFNEPENNPTNPDTAPSAQQELEGEDLQSAIQRTVDGLPEQCRLIFTLSKFEHLSHKEISEQLGISVKTIENQMTKALRILRAALERYR